MKKLLLVLSFLLAITVSSSYSQISNLLVLGKTTSFSISSGDDFGWSYNVPQTGDTTLVQIWIDADQNGILNPAVDVMWTYFNQIDGDPHGQNGPPDGDMTPNSSVAFRMPIGLAPAHYILLFRNHEKYTTFTGTVNHMASPAYTISGNVNVPNGIGKKNIVVMLESQGDNGSGIFWNGLTDDNGNYTIEMNSDTTGNPWAVMVSNSFILGAGVVDPEEHELHIYPKVTTYTGNNFSFTPAGAVVNGRLLSEEGNPVIGGRINYTSSDGSFYRDAQTDTAGTFKIGLRPGELPQATVMLFAPVNDPLHFVAPYFMRADRISAGNTYTHDLIIYKTNSTISGKVLVDGKTPNYSIEVFCTNVDSVYTSSWTERDGSFSVPVTSKVFSYDIGPVNNYAQGPVYNYTPIGKVAAGASNIILNLNTTDVKERPNAPEEFSLSQNYPNPFNPVTTINYSVAKEGFVTLTVYNLIGSKVATLVSEYKPAGHYSIQFNGSNLASGIYLYKLESGNSRAYKKLVLMK